MWLRLVSKRVEAGILALELVAGLAQDGPGCALNELHELVLAGDCVRISVALGQFAATSADLPEPEVRTCPTRSNLTPRSSL